MKPEIQINNDIISEGDDYAELQIGSIIIIQGSYFKVKDISAIGNSCLIYDILTGLTVPHTTHNLQIFHGTIIITQ